MQGTLARNFVVPALPALLLCTLAAVLPSVVYTLMAMSAFVWLVRNR